MTMLKKIAEELIGMFVGEWRMTIAVLAIVAVTGSLIEFTGLDELVGGVVLLFGCLILLVDNIHRSARPRAF